ncbi:MAG: hypothetical protein AAF919_00570 [Pseudomonadota bacterium]
MAPAYVDDPQARTEAIDELDEQLVEIARVLPPDSLKAVRMVPIWLEYRKSAPRRSVYHRSEGWLEKNGFNPEKARAIEVDHGIVGRHGSGSLFVLHELAHGYYDIALGRTAPSLDRAYTAAMEAGLYDDVRRASGRRGRAYAATNVSEYFAELSESYFGRNDFQPFDRAELRSFDPAGYAAVRSLWFD